MQNCHNFDQWGLLNYLQCPISDGPLIIESFVSFWHKKISQAYLFFPITIYPPYTFLPQIWNHLFVQGALVLFSEKTVS